MARTIPFGTHAYVKKLRAVGVPEAQAEVQAEAFAELISDQLATKRDLAELELRLTSQIKQLELRVVMKLGAIVAAAVAVLAALEKF